MTDADGPIALYAMFTLDGMTEEDYLAHADDVAPRFAEIDGLISKVWLADRAQGRYGALYLFASRQAVVDFMASDFGQEQAQAPFCRDIVVQELDVLPGPTQVTHGLP